MSATDSNEFVVYTVWMYQCSPRAKTRANEEAMNEDYGFLGRQDAKDRVWSGDRGVGGTPRHRVCAKHCFLLELVLGACP
jgi:hypothetical protein